MTALERTPAAADRYSPTPLQAGMLYHRWSERDAEGDVQQVVLFSNAPLDDARLRHAWQTVSDRHEALRTSFRLGAGGPMAEIATAPAVPFAVDEHPGCSGDRRAELIEAALAAERAGIDPNRAPLARVRVLRFAENDRAIVWTNHHAILDGRARSIVLGEIAGCYAGRELPPATAQFSQHAAWLAQRDVRGDERFWRDYLVGIPGTAPLPARASAAGSPARTMPAIRTLDAAETSRLAALAHAFGVTTTTIVHAAWALLLSRCAGTPDVVFGAVRACRHSGTAGGPAIVGPLINALPLRIRVDEGAAVGEWLRHVSSQWHALRDFEHTPLSAISAWADRPQPQQLFTSIVAVEHEPLAVRIRTAIDPAGCLGIYDALVSDRTTYPLTLAAAGTERLELRLQADPVRYEGGDALRLIDMLSTILRNLPDAAGARVRDVSMTAPAERGRVLGFNHERPFPRDATIHALFADVVARRPHAVAAQLGATTITYADLERRATNIAAHLRALGVGRGSYVGLCVERSFDMLAALIGIVQAGAASVALDPQQPAERIAFMLGESGARVVLAQSRLLAELAPALALQPAGAVRAVSLDAIPPHDGAFVPDPNGGPLDAAHVMYTSGSTGTPKGAVLPHRAVVRTVCGADYLTFDETETFFAFVPLTFDVSVLEIWGPLLNGARVVLAPPGLPSLDVLASIVEAGGVTTLWLTTALFEHMVDDALPQLRGLHALIVGGDVMSPAHARRAMEALPDTRLLNVYGPTEATVLITAQPLRMPLDGPIPIGAPIANARVYLLDSERRPVPAGVPGEIFTGGDGLALGYLNRPDLTAERFMPDPFDDRPGATMYRTGDLGRWNADGSIHFLGRLDTQTKINGIRVELGEIEAALTAHPGLREAVVIATAAPEKHLVAYAVARTTPPAMAELRAFLARRVPAHMLPAHVVFLPALPLTPTGKFDRKALPAAELPLPGANTPSRAPLTAAQITVAAHVATILDRSGEIGLDDDFFETGGDSLRAMRLVARLRDVFGVDLSIRDLLAAPTVAGLTTAIGGLVHGATRPPAPLLTAVREGGSKTPFVYLHGDLAGGGYYCSELGRRIDADRPFFIAGPHNADIESAARATIAALHERGIGGPVILGGFCNGGVVAYEMARRLERAGFAVERVVLVDAFPRNIGRSTGKRIRAGARALLERLRIVRNRRPDSPGENASWERWHEYQLEHQRVALADYSPGRYAGEVVLLWTDESSPQAGAFTALWRRVAPRARSGRVPGDHLTSITRHLARTCAVLAEHVDGTPARWDQRANSVDHLQRTPAAAAVLRLGESFSTRADGVQ